MATDITFGIKTDPVATTKVDSGALGNTANSSSAVASTPTPQIASGPMSPYIDNNGPMSVNPVNSSVDTTQLESASSSGVVLPQPTQTQRIQTSTPSVQDPANAELDRITGEAKRIQDTLNKNKEQYDLQDIQKKAKEDIGTAFDSLASIGKFESSLGDAIELQKKKELKTEIDNKILKKERDFDLALRAAEDTFGTRAQKNAAKAEISKNYNRELADLSIIQMARAGEYNDAKAYVDQKVQLEMQDRKANLDKLMFFYAENKERLTELDQRAFQAKILKDERAYQEQLAKTQNFENFRFGLIQAAISAGAGNGTLAALQSATSMEELIQRDLSIFAPKATGSSGFAVPTVKEINGVDMQWDPVTGQWVEIPGGGQSDYSTAKVEQTRGVISDLLTKAVASPGIFGRTASLPIPNFARTDAFRDYSGQLDTLKANIAFNELASMREASKTGGALGAVSERELSLLENSLGGLKMNQTPAQVQSELKKIDASLARWQSAMSQYGGSNGGTIVTAPDGTQVEIID